MCIDNGRSSASWICPGCGAPCASVPGVNGVDHLVSHPVNTSEQLLASTAWSTNCEIGGVWFWCPTQFTVVHNMTTIVSDDVLITFASRIRKRQIVNVLHDDVTNILPKLCVSLCVIWVTSATHFWATPTFGPQISPLSTPQA